MMISLSLLIFSNYYFQTVFGETLTLPVELGSENINQALASYILEHLFSTDNAFVGNGIVL